MRAKTINEYGDGYLPAGAANDPRAPYNQSDPTYNLEIEDGELVLYSDYGEGETMRFDPADVDELLSAISGIPLEDGDTFEIHDIVTSGDRDATIATDKGNIDINFDDLESLY